MIFSRLQRFFWMCAGTSVTIIEKYPTEHRKYFGIGATIFFTALFAALSGGYALYFVFAGSSYGEFSSILFGIIWGLAILNLDRSIVSGIKKNTKGMKQFYQASPRFVFAVLIALVIARPLELKIFDKEIHEQLKTRYLSEQNERIVKVQQLFTEKYALELSQIKTYQEEYDKLSSEVNRLREELKREVFGFRTSTTSGVVGYGTYAKNKELVVIAKQTRLEFLAAQLSEQQVNLNRQKTAEGINNLTMLTDDKLDIKASRAGFADRNWALSELTHARNDVSKSSATAILCITLLFVVFECAPLIVKLLAEVGPSDVDIKESESRIISQLTNTSYLSRNRTVREYRFLGSKFGGRRAKKFVSNKRGWGRYR